MLCTSRRLPAAVAVGGGGGCRRRSGWLVPSAPLFHPIINAVIRLAMALLPFALEYLERWAAQERYRRSQRDESRAQMHRPMTVAEARDILGVPSTTPGADRVPFQKGTEARRIADANFRKFFESCQPPSPTADESPEGKSDAKQAQPGVRSAYLAGKFSGAYRLLVDDKWDEK